MSRASFILFFAWLFAAPWMAWQAALNLPPIAAVCAGAAICAGSIALGIWRAYRDSLP